MNAAARHTSPIPIAEFQMIVNLSASGASLARCVPTTDAYQVDAFPSALVLKDGIEPADTRICNAICKVVIPEHTLNIQVLNTDRTHLTVVRKLMSNLVNIVEPLVGNLGMNSSYVVLYLLPVGRPLRLVTQFPLVVLQALLSGFRKVLSWEFTTIGADCKGLNADINSNCGTWIYDSAGLLAEGGVDKDGGIVFPVRIHRNGNILDLAIKASVKNDRDILALGDAESLMLPVDGAVLRIVERLLVLLAFEQRVSSSMLPPVFESICDLLDGILQRLRVDLAKPRVYLLQGGELLLGAEATYTDSSSAPHHRHVVKRAIVCNTAAAEALGEELRLIHGRI